MISVDTNVVLRLILADDADQVAAIRAMMARTSLFLTLTVLLETGWVLESRYRMTRQSVADALTSVIDLDGVEVARRALVQWAVSRYRSGADWADMIHIAAAARLDGFATLDRGLLRRAGERSPVAIELLA